MEPIDRRTFMATSGMLAAGALAQRAQADSAAALPERPGKPPNLVFIFTDEHPDKAWSRHIPCLKTPNLDRLAREGTTVTNCISNNPICVPYRATLLTGQHGHFTGFVNNHERFPLAGEWPSWSKALKAAGYAMGYVGKWHLYPGCEDPTWKDDRPDGEVAQPASLTPPELRHGFDDLWVQTSNHNRPRNTYVWDKDGAYRQIDGYAPEFLTDRLLEFIDENRDADRPFCGVLSLLPPHPSYAGAKQHWVDYYHGIETPYWENVPAEDRTEPRMRDLKDFYAQISSLDEEVGRVLDKLDETGLADNTIVIFTTDHGDLHYAHGVKWKRYPYEESIRVPFVVRHPGKVRAGAVDDLLLGAIDLAPTLLGLTGHGDRIDPAMSGMNLAGRLCTGRGPEPESQFILYNLPEETHYIIKKQPRLMDYRGVRTKRWTYTLQKDRHSGAVAPWHLFDNLNDPLQMNNLCDSGDHADVRQRLAGMIRAHLHAVGEPQWLENTPKDRTRIPGPYGRSRAST